MGTAFTAQSNARADRLEPHKHFRSNGGEARRRERGGQGAVGAREDCHRLGVPVLPPLRRCSPPHSASASTTPLDSSGGSFRFFPATAPFAPPAAASASEGQCPMAIASSVIVIRTALWIA